MQNAFAVHATERYRTQNAALTDLILIVLGSLFVAAVAQITIYLPFSPVPITGQTFAVLLIGMLLGAKRGVSALALYLAEGAAGLPVFAGASAGIAVIIGPTGGYLIGFVAAAWLLGTLAERGWGKNLLSTLGAFALGSALIYLFGVGWLSNFMGLNPAIVAGLTPFLLGDAAKAILAAVLLPSAWKWLGSSSD